MMKEMVNAPVSEVNFSLVKKQCRNSLMPDQKCVVLMTLEHVWTEPDALQSKCMCKCAGNNIVCNFVMAVP
jgi:hypothetical protein